MFLGNAGYPATTNLTEARETVSRLFSTRYGKVPPADVLETEAQNWVKLSQAGSPYEAFVAYWDQHLSLATASAGKSRHYSSAMASWSEKVNSGEIGNEPAAAGSSNTTLIMLGLGGVALALYLKNNNKRAKSTKMKK
ncbi:MAG TPA: hypothetical protein VK927_02550 [Adhaeribacter sp.]|nr:hypothetical protein [Adhaeribacter sp.]